jgi:hypothetical protein
MTTARCPGCGAVCWPQWLITHRPGCEYEAFDTEQWPTTYGKEPK